MAEYVILHPMAMEPSGFKIAVEMPAIGESDDLDEARRLAHAAGGGAIFRMRFPKGNPITPGGHQPFGQRLQDQKELEWKCLVDAVAPGSMACKEWGLEP